MSAPDRIWIDRGPKGGWMKRFERMPDSEHEYIRADLCDPTKDEQVKALVEALHGEATHRLSGHPHRPDMPKVYAALRVLEQGE